MTKPDWNAIAQPDVSVIGDPRSCVNCVHSAYRNTIRWCQRTQAYCEHTVRNKDGACGIDLKYWTPKPLEPPKAIEAVQIDKPVSWWRRLLGLT